jgi:hypothetical protein
LTIVVLLILAVVWAAVLGPGMLKRVLERRSGDSIGMFHRQLRVLERAGPTLVAPAFRLTVSHPESGPRHVPPRALTLVPPDVPTRRGASRGDAGGRPGRDPYFRPGACKRRRDVLLWLVTAVLGTGVLGAIPELRILLAVTALCFVLMALYLAMLVRMRSRAVERTVKLRYLPRPVAEPTIVVRRSAAR